MGLAIFSTAAPASLETQSQAGCCSLGDPAGEDKEGNEDEDEEKQEEDEERDEDQSLYMYT